MAYKQSRFNSKSFTNRKRIRRSVGANSRIVTADGLSERIDELKLGKEDARALKRELIRLEKGNISKIASSPSTHKVTVSGNDVYSLRASQNLRVMFGVDKEKNKVLIYDIYKT